MTTKDHLREYTPHFILDLIGRYKFIQGTNYFSEHPVRATFRLVRWMIFVWSGKDISFTTPDGTHFVSMPHNYSSFIIYFADYRDPDIQAFLLQHLKKDSVFVDAGANVGTYAIRASQLVGPEGKVIAIEAHPFICGYLIKNIKLNSLKNVTVINAALGAEQGTIEMSYTKSNAGETHVAVHGEKKINVPMKTLDEVREKLDIPKIDYLKIDVEGFEFSLLMGAQKVIETNHDIIIQTELVESHSQRYGRPITEVIDLLFHWGLLPHEIDSMGKSSAVKKSELKLPGDFLWWRE